MRAAINTYRYTAPSPCPDMAGWSCVSEHLALSASAGGLAVPIVATSPLASTAPRFADSASQVRGAA